MAKKTGKPETQVEILLRLSNEANFFSNELEEAYAIILISNHKEIWKVKSKKFKMWLIKKYYEETNKAPTSDAVNQTTDAIEMKAVFYGEKHPLHLRVAEKEDAFYYDLANDNWSVVKVKPNHCQVVNDPPILFSRKKSTKAQVLPNFDGDLKLLLNHVRISNEDEQILFLTYIVTCFIPNIPHVVLVFSGEKGAAKSTSLRMARQIVDPAVQDLLSMPNSMQDLAINLANNYMPTYDNLESLSSEKSDIICISSTGGGISKRTLYSDDDETLLDIKRCVGLTGINVVVTKSDLIDRSVIIELERIPENQRKVESEIWEAFEKDKASIVGGALSTLSKAMELYPNVKLNRLPRMADFTKWGYAIAEVLGYGGDRFLKAYQNNRNRFNEEAISSHPVASAMVAFMNNKVNWTGSVSELLCELEKVAQNKKIDSSKLFPKAAHVLSRRLNEVKSNLEDVGITFSIQNIGEYKEISILKNQSTMVTPSNNRNTQTVRKKLIPTKKEHEARKKLFKM